MKAMSAECTICRQPAVPNGTKKGHALHKCTQCGHLFFWPLPEDTISIYTGDYFQGAKEGFGYQDYDADKEVMTSTFLHYLDLIQKQNPPQGPLLDVGAATGFFLNLARQRDWQVAGVEPSDAAASIGRSKQLDVRTGTLDQELGWGAESFAVITMWDVIEHLRDPHHVLQNVSGLLKTGGILAINTPDASSILSRVLGTNWHLVIPYEHLNLFSCQSLAIALRAHGFEPILVTRIGKKFTLPYVMSTLAHWQGIHLWQWIADWSKRQSWHASGIPINLFDNVFVLARKQSADK